MKTWLDFFGRVVTRNGEMPPFPVNTTGTQKARKGRRYEGKFKSEKQIPRRETRYVGMTETTAVARRV